MFSEKLCDVLKPEVNKPPVNIERGIGEVMLSKGVFDPAMSSNVKRRENQLAQENVLVDTTKSENGVDIIPDSVRAYFPENADLGSAWYSGRLTREPSGRKSMRRIVEKN